jgi:hypothetical protein
MHNAERRLHGSPGDASHGAMYLLVMAGLDPDTSLLA